MRREILFGSIFVLALILLMPSIPAIEQKTIEDKAYSDFIEKIEEFDFEDIGKLDDMKHPILYSFVMTLYNHMNNRLNRVGDRFTLIIDFIINNFDVSLYNELGKLLIVIIFIRVNSLVLPIMYYSLFWYNLSETLGWNWDIEPY